MKEIRLKVLFLFVAAMVLPLGLISARNVCNPPTVKIEAGPNRTLCVGDNRANQVTWDPAASQDGCKIVVTTSPRGIVSVSDLTWACTVVQPKTLTIAGLALGQAVVTLTLQGWNGTAYVDLASDTINVNVVEVKVTHIKFDYTGPDTGTSDGLNIRKSYADDLDHAGNGVGDGEWMLSPTRNEPFLYVVDNAVKIQAKFKVTPAINIALDIKADSVGSRFPSTETKTVSFTAGISPYVEFGFIGANNRSHNFDGNADKDVSICVDSWQWKIVDGTWSCNMNTSGPHTNYCVLGIPYSPWYNSASAHPWVSALDIACKGTWAGGATDLSAAVSNITVAINALGGPGSSQFEYDYAPPSPPHYSVFSTRTVKLTKCINRIHGAVLGSGFGWVNCVDCANFVITFGNLVAPHVCQLKMAAPRGGSSPSFELNPVIVIGETGYWTGWRFGMHCVAVDKTTTSVDGNLVYDACLKIDYDSDPSSPVANDFKPAATLPFSDTTPLAPYVYRERLAVPGASGYDRCIPDPASRIIYYDTIE